METRQITGQEAEEVIARQSFNELGQLESKQLGGNLQQLDYRYNIRGWLTAVNDAGLSNKKDLFGLELSYDSGIRYDANGNILSMHRQGLLSSINGQNQFGPIDKLSYAYQGNRLIAVDDGIETKSLTIEI